MDKQFELIAFTAWLEKIKKDFDYGVENHYPKEIIEETRYDENWIHDQITDIRFALTDVIQALKEARYDIKETPE